MKKNKSTEKIKHFAKKKWDKFADWFKDKEHPHSRLNKNVFFHDSLKLIGLILVFLIINSDLDKINQIVLIFIKLGSLFQLILLFFILRKSWHLVVNLKYAFRGLNYGMKAIIALVIVLLLFLAFLNQGQVIGSINKTYQETNLSKLNPIQFSSNFTLFHPDKNSSSGKIIPFLKEDKELSDCKEQIKEESRKLKERSIFPTSTDIREYNYFNKTSDAVKYLQEWQIAGFSSSLLDIYYKDFTRDYDHGFWLFLVRINIQVEGQTVGVLKPIMCVDGKLTQESKERFN